MLLISLCQETLVHVLVCGPGIKPFFLNKIPSSATFCKILVFLHFFIYLLNGSIECFFFEKIHNVMMMMIMMCMMMSNFHQH